MDMWRTLMNLLLLSLLTACGGGGGGGGSNSSDSGSSSSVSQIPSAPAPVDHVLYITSASDSSIMAYAIDSSTGELTPVQESPFNFDPGSNAISLIVHPSNKFIYAVTYKSWAPLMGGSVKVTSLGIDATSGSLISTGVSDLGYSKTGFGGFQLGKSGSFIYWWSLSNSASVCKIDVTTGALGICGFTGGGNFPQTINPITGIKYEVSTEILQYQMDLDNYDGSTAFVPQTLIGTVSAMQGPGGRFISFSPKYHYAYSIATGSNTVAPSIAIFKADPVSGILTRVSATNTPLSNFNRVLAARYSLDEKFMYLRDSNNVYVYRVDPVSGDLSLTGNSVAVDGTSITNTGSIVFHPSGKFALLVTANASIAVLRINQATGELTPVAGSPFGTTGSSPGGILIDPSGKFVYVPDSINATITLYNFDVDTGLLSARKTYPAGTSPGNANIVVLH